MSNTEDLQSIGCSKHVAALAKVEVQYEGHGQYAVYLDEEKLSEFDNFDQAAEEFEKLGGVFECG